MGTLWGPALLVASVALPFLAAGASLWLSEERADLAVRSSTAAALVLVALITLAPVDIAIQLPAGRALMLTPITELGVELLALAMLGLVMSLRGERRALIAGWLPVAWLSLGGLTVGLLMTSLPLALIAFTGSALLWAFGLPAAERSSDSVAGATVLRYTALLALAAPLLLAAFRLAEGRTTSALADDPTVLAVLALAVPGFGLVLGLMPLHALTLTLASGTPRAMLFGVLTLVQTAGFVLLLRTLATYPWMIEEAKVPLIAGGALSALVGGWLAASARGDDPDDWLVYAAVANGGLLLAGIGAQSRAAGAGVALLLLARVLALVLLALAPRVRGTLHRLARAAGTLTLAGAPGLAGFPGLWLILRGLQERGGSGTQLAALALLAGCGFLFATAVRRWPVEPPDARAPGAEDASRVWLAVVVLVALLVILGLAPQAIAPAMADALRDMFFARP